MGERLDGIQEVGGSSPPASTSLRPAVLPGEGRRGFGWQASNARGRRLPAEALAEAGHQMKWVYLLESLAHPTQHYVGLTDNVSKRLAAHNAGQSAHTAKHKPWKLVAAIRLADDSHARAFEKYLKSGSGRAFVKRRFL